MTILMTSKFRPPLLLASIFVVFGFGIASFPENNVPISVTSVNDVPHSFFTGGDSTADVLRYTQELKMITIAGREYFAITAREKLFLIRPEDFSPKASSKIPLTEVFTWKTDETVKDLCVLKGQSDENCENYIRVLEQMDDNGNKLLVCGTNSYVPKCMYLSASTRNNELILTQEGKDFSGIEKCAFGPDQTGVSLYTGDSLYSATVSEFRGRSYTIMRSLGDEKQLKTPKFDNKFLHQPYFVKMVDDGERVLIFMNEMVETENGDVGMVAYVAQVCKNDIGGTHVLVNQWTKFEKTRLNCSLNGFYFDQLQDVSDPVDVKMNSNSQKTVKTIYATFTTPEYSVPGSAVCSFTLDSIHDALLGRFREERGASGDKSSAPTGAKHPGKCPNKQYTESELLFVKSHPLLEDQARGGLLTTYVGERWTSIAVDSAAGPSKNWTVYFVGTATGEILRYLAPTGGLKHAVLLRRQEVFDSTSCGNATLENMSVTSIATDPERNQILVTFKNCVLSVPLRSCNMHKCKKSCIASADPYCGWNGTDCIEHVQHSSTVEQHVYTEAVRPKSEIEKLCPNDHIITPDIKPVNKPVLKETEGRTDGNNGEDIQPDFNITNGSFVEGGKGTEKKLPTGEQGAQEADSVEYVKLHVVIAIAAGVGVLFFIVGFVASKKCCIATQKDIEKQPEEMSKNSETLCKRFISSISPNRTRKQAPKKAQANQSAPTSDQQNVPLVAKDHKDHSKLDEYIKAQDPGTYDPMLQAHTLQLPDRKSRLHSTSSASQVTMTESLASYNAKRRSSNQPTSSTSSMSKPRPNYSTAPRTRHYSGNRTSDPSEYSNAPTLRADRSHSRMSSRHSTPAPTLPTTPSSIDSFPQFQFPPLPEDTTQTLDGLKEVIEQQQRRSAEMEPVIEESEEARFRHESSDSGKGSSPRNSVQTEEQDKISTLSRSRPDQLIIGPSRGRKRLNSDPTSPTTPHPPLPPPSSHKPVTRSTSMRSQHAMSVPHYKPRKRSESFSHQQAQTPLGVQQMVQHGFHPQAQPNIYATLPSKQSSTNNVHPHMDKYHKHGYEQYVPLNGYPVFEQRDHPAMNMPEKYSSLPLRSQAHRSNKKQYTGQYLHHPGQHPRRNSGAPQIPHGFQKQMSSPGSFDQPRPQRLRYVPPPTVPSLPASLPEQNAV